MIEPRSREWHETGYLNGRLVWIPFNGPPLAGVITSAETGVLDGNRDNPDVARLTIKWLKKRNGLPLWSRIKLGWRVMIGEA